MRAEEETASVVETSSPEQFERLRRLLSWISISVFAATFVALLILSGTVYWTPENHWLTLLDRAWRVSGLVGLILWTVPYVLRFTRWLASVFAGS